MMKWLPKRFKYTRELEAALRTETQVARVAEAIIKWQKDAIKELEQSANDG